MCHRVSALSREVLHLKHPVRVKAAAALRAFQGVSAEERLFPEL